MFNLNFVFVAIPLILIWGLYRINIIKKRKRFEKLNELFINLFFIYLLTVIYLTFFKQGYLRLTFDRIAYVNLIPFVETIKMFNSNFMGIGNTIYNVGGNILLFAPLGFFIPLLFKKENKLCRIALYGAIFSITIEALQFLTATNITDIDDIIFNTLGAMIGYLIYNICIKILYRTKFINLIDKIVIDYTGSFLILSFKLLIPTILISIFAIYSGLYYSTTSGKLSDEDIAKNVFSYNTSDNYVAFTEFSEYKFFLADYGNYIDLLTAKRVLNNRWTQGGGAYQLNLENKDSGYSIATFSENNNENLAIIVWGKNFDAESIEITFNGQEYSQELRPNDYFIVPFPTFETVSENTDIYNIFEGEESKDLIIKFKEKNGDECKHIHIN